MRTQKEVAASVDTIAGIAKPLNDDGASLISSQCLFIGESALARTLLDELTHPQLACARKMLESKRSSWSSSMPVGNEQVGRSNLSEKSCKNFGVDVDTLG